MVFFSLFIKFQAVGAWDAENAVVESNRMFSFSLFNGIFSPELVVSAVAHSSLGHCLLGCRENTVNEKEYEILICFYYLISAFFLMFLIIIQHSKSANRLQLFGDCRCQKLEKNGKFKLEFFHCLMDFLVFFLYCVCFFITHLYIATSAFRSSAACVLRKCRNLFFLMEISVLNFHFYLVFWQVSWEQLWWYCLWLKHLLNVFYASCIYFDLTFT